MKRFVIAAALATVLSFSFTETANAQIVYGYSVPRGGGVMSGGTYLSPGLQQGYQTYYSPFTGVMTSQVYGRNFLGEAYGRAYAYDPRTGLNYNRTVYQPNYYFNPYGGYSWTTLKRWGW